MRLVVALHLAALLERYHANGFDVVDPAHGVRGVFPHDAIELLHDFEASCDRRERFVAQSIERQGVVDLDYSHF